MVLRTPYPQASPASDPCHRQHSEQQPLLKTLTRVFVDVVGSLSWNAASARRCGWGRLMLMLAILGRARAGEVDPKKLTLVAAHLRGRQARNN
jgi:hypothetical protein